MNDDKILRLNDKLIYEDNCDTNPEEELLMKKGFASPIRTDVQMGYDYYRDENGVSRLGEVVLSHLHNHITVGGINFILEKAFGTKAGIVIKNLNEKYGIGTNVHKANIDDKGSRIMLFNIGLDGCGAAYSDIKEVLVQQNDVVPIGEDNVYGSMIPFRVVDVGESVTDDPGVGGPYWFKKTIETEAADGTLIKKDHYYLKEFEKPISGSVPNPEIINRWRDNGVDDGTVVTDNPENSSRSEGIESYVEIVLRINRNDLREYFDTYQSKKDARFNSIGLCSGIKSSVYDEDNETTYFEYTDVRQISVLNFSNEMLHFEKDLTIIYRIYLS